MTLRQIPFQFSSQAWPDDATSKDTCLDYEANDDGESVMACASCHATENLGHRDDDSLVVFCRDCTTSASTQGFPEYYCDLGGRG